MQGPGLDRFKKQDLDPVIGLIRLDSRVLFRGSNRLRKVLEVQIEDPECPVLNNYRT